MRSFGACCSAAALLASGVTSASATMRIAEDRGGQIGHYLQAFALLRSSGEHVVVDGNCLSACTLVLGLIPRSHICATPRARFGFHAAWMPDVDGRPVTSADGHAGAVEYLSRRSAALDQPPRRLVAQDDLLQGRELNGIVASCEQRRARRHACTQRSERRYAARPVRYIAANAASDRR